MIPKKPAPDLIRGGYRFSEKIMLHLSDAVRALSPESHRIDRRQRVRHAGPAVALVLAHPQPASGRAEGEALARVVERQRVAVDHVIGMRLRQPLAQDVKALAAIAGARDHQLALARDALLVLDLRHEPRGIRIARMHCDGEAEGRRLDSGDLGKAPALV